MLLPLLLATDSSSQDDHDDTVSSDPSRRAFTYASFLKTYSFLLYTLISCHNFGVKYTEFCFDPLPPPLSCFCAVTSWLAVPASCTFSSRFFLPNSCHLLHRLRRYRAIVIGFFSYASLGRLFVLKLVTSMGASADVSFPFSIPQPPVP